MYTIDFSVKWFLSLEALLIVFCTKKGVGWQEGIHNKTSAIQEIGKSIFWTIHAFITSLAGMSYKIGVVFKMAFYEQTVQR